MLEEKVFLGGTCNETDWREKLIPMLTINYFNPVVEDWTPECQLEEYRQKESSRYHLYVITPRMSGTFSIAEIIQSTHTKDVVTILYVQKTDKDDDGNEITFNKGQIKSLEAVSALATKNGAIICHSLEDVAYTLNNLGNDIDYFIEQLSVEDLKAQDVANIVKGALIKIKTILL